MIPECRSAATEALTYLTAHAPTRRLETGARPPLASVRRDGLQWCLRRVGVASGFISAIGLQLGFMTVAHLYGFAARVELADIASGVPAILCANIASLPGAGAAGAVASHRVNRFAGGSAYVTWAVSTLLLMLNLG
jgi:hypothetical protein